MAQETPTSIPIPATISVKHLAERLNQSVSQVIMALMAQGVMATINETVDYATAAKVAETFELAVSPEGAPAPAEDTAKAKTAGGKTRPPVIAVMGHVDHGKTTLLDAIRHTEVAAKEAGGITQHLSAYQITYKKRKITFLDTPGHEAFTLLREHGAHLTDVAIIVVAADDGVKPQTEEAIKFAERAGVKMVVALTKVDKAGVDTNRVKQQLAELGLNPEDWGGDTVMVEVSGTTGAGVDKLLELVLLVTDIEELKARPSGPAEGTVIEAHMARGQGAVATLLVEQGELKPGDFIGTATTYAKVRRLESTDGASLKTAGPSTPVQVTGWKALPNLGERFSVAASEKAVRTQVKATTSELDIQLPTAEAAARLTGNSLPLVVKADVHGSLESVIKSLLAINTGEVGVQIVAQGVGPISEKDVYLAAAGKGSVIGFNVELPVRIKQLAEKAGVPVRLYKVIYNLIDDVHADVEALLAPETVEEVVGELELKGVFRVTQKLLICGGQVTKGVLKPDLFVRYVGQEKEIGRVTNLQLTKVDVKEMKQGETGGLSIATAHKVNAKIGEKLEFFTRETKTRTLAD